MNFVQKPDWFFSSFCNSNIFALVLRVKVLYLPAINCVVTVCTMMRYMYVLSSATITRFCQPPVISGSLSLALCIYMTVHDCAWRPTLSM